MVRRGDLNVGYPCLCERRPGTLQSPVRQTRCLSYRERYPTAGLNDCCGYRQEGPSVRKHPDASSLQPELRRLYRVWVAIVELYAGNKKSARIFLNAPNKHLENQAPVEFIEKGDLKPLESLAEAMCARAHI